MARLLSELHPVMRDAAGALRRLYGGTVTSTYRSLAEQRALYARRAVNPYPVAPPGTTTHHTGLAFDYVVGAGARSPAQLEAGRTWVAAGGRWTDRDVVHFEHPVAKEALRRGLTGRRWWA